MIYKRLLAICLDCIKNVKFVRNLIVLLHKYYLKKLNRKVNKGLRKVSQRYELQTRQEELES